MLGRACETMKTYNLFNYCARMRKKRRLAELKDDLLLEIFTPKQNLKDLFNEVEYCERKKENPMKVLTIINQLETMGFIKRGNYETDKGEKGYYWSTMATGYFFRFEEGGFTSLHYTERNKHRLYIAKMTANILNALAIIIITIIGLFIQWGDKRVEKENDVYKIKNERLENNVKNLQKEVKELKTQIHIHKVKID